MPKNSQHVRTLIQILLEFLVAKLITITRFSSCLKEAELHIMIY